VRNPEVVEIGSAHGKIALYLTETEAIDLAHLYGLDDTGAQEIMEAVEKAYPPPTAQEFNDAMGAP
jgi:hypothetical protein